ncbi:MAG: ATP-binding protein [Planctomycetaceae bacterium]
MARGKSGKPSSDSPAGARGPAPAGAGPAGPVDVDIEGLGVLYLGRTVDPDTCKAGPEPLLLDSRRLTTHAVCVGMTGSGKTGLLVSLVEEAAIDGIPALVIDPKGDLANLLLSFPSLAPADFLPWLDADAARREGLSLEELSERTARKWRDGLAATGQSPERIGMLRDAVEMAVYTPGSAAGRPLAMLESLEAPPRAILDDPEARRERIESLVSGILAMAGIDAEPGRSREHLLVSAIVDALWREGKPVDFGTLVRAVQAPPIERVGFLELENFFPAADRFQLAGRLNTVAATPGFDAWLHGEPLDVGRLLWTPEGKPRVSVVSIAHLGDAQRMAFVTLLAGAAVTWTRSQPGTSSLKALFLMDEVFGYLPPTANPPSKLPLLTLLKQARAFGLGVVLATQNPVDLDYKALSNAGTWFLGRLQTARDKARVLDGLEGAASSSGSGFDRERVERLLAGLEQRQFLLHSVHDDAETVFQTRWTLSFLRGPVLREEIRRLGGAPAPAAAAAAGTQASRTPSGTRGAGGPRPILPPGVRELFLEPEGPAADGPATYEPCILGRARVRFTSTKGRVDVVRETYCLAPASEQLGESAWEGARQFPEAPAFAATPSDGGFGALPGALVSPKAYATLATALKGHLARTARMSLFAAPSIDAVSLPGETEGEFRVRVGQRVKEWRDRELDRLGDKHAAKLASLNDRILRARQKVEKEKAEAKSRSMQTYVSIGTAVFTALFGRKVASSATVGRAATSMRSASRAARQQADVAHAEESLSELEEKLVELEARIAEELDEVRVRADPDSLVLEPIEVAPRKTDVSVEEVLLAWVPAEAGPGGRA